ncbi:hypothetical protein M758_12G055600 [Ceratodon purpureus]|nr:hypothetical protein M758_12G055600 [Ceratodon purpureus]
MPAMATVETMARSQNELLEAGRAKLAKFQSRNKGKKTGKKAASVADAKIYVNGDATGVVGGGGGKGSEIGKENVDRNGVDADQGRRIGFEADANRGERVVEESRRHFGAVELAERGEKDEEERRRQREVEEVRRKELDAEEASRREREAEEVRNQQVQLERLKRMRQEAEESRQRQREAEEVKRKDRERQDAEEARKQALIAEREAEEARRKEAEDAKRKEREAEQRRQRVIAEITRKKQLEEEEMKRKEREAEEIRRKDREAEEVQRRQRDEDEFRRKQREEFASLEQHIQDLTEEKFGLQRELAKARGMTENFVQEHSALVESFNNQGQMVNQLKEEIEQLEERIKERDAYAMALMTERDRAEQDSAAAREQSQTMAGEVIVLENRIRTLRSHELKLEKDMGILSSEVESHRKQGAAWEKDRAHLQTLIDALQEEKKVLQVRLRKVASGEREFTYKSESSEALQLKQRVMTDASTSTDDLPPPLQISSEGPSTPLDSPSLDSWHHGRRFEEPLSTQSTAQSSHLRSAYESSQSPFVRSPKSSDKHSQVLFPESRPLSLPVSTDSSQSGGYQRIQLPASLTAMPADVMRTINNINDVITSLGEEKTAIVKALKAESKGAAELRALNADLSRKLEATTQQLELVVAQRMADGHAASEHTTRNAVAALDYIDEGDEVVDRVFNWIVQLFPSRSSRRIGVKRL